jgi:hypothetical protein
VRWCRSRVALIAVVASVGWLLARDVAAQAQSAESDTAANITRAGAKGSPLVIVIDERANTSGWEENSQFRICHLVDEAVETMRSEPVGLIVLSNVMEDVKKVREVAAAKGVKIITTELPVIDPGTYPNNPVPGAPLTHEQGLKLVQFMTAQQQFNATIDQALGRQPNTAAQNMVQHLKDLMDHAAGQETITVCCQPQK